MIRNSKNKGRRGPRRGRKQGPGGVTRDRGRMWIQTNGPYRHLARPLRPLRDAQLTVKQFANTFNTESGLANLGGATPAQLIVNNSTGTNFAIAFTLADLAQAASYTALFDQYRIERVLLRLKARNNAVALENTASPNASVPSGFIVIDRDDSTAPTGIPAVQEYDTAEYFSGEQDVTIDLVPSITPSVFSSGAFSAYSIQDARKVWIDVANTIVPYYGVKGAASGLTLATTSSWVWDITAEYIVSFKNIR